MSFTGCRRIAHSARRARQQQGHLAPFVRDQAIAHSKARPLPSNKASSVAESLAFCIGAAASEKRGRPAT